MNVKIEYQFTRDDYAAVLRQASRSNSRFWVPAVATLSLIVLIAFLYDIVVTKSGPSFSNLIEYLLRFMPIWMFVILYPLYMFFRHRIAQFKFSSLAIANRTVHMVLDDFGIHAKVGEVESRILWSEIPRLVQTPEALFLFLFSAQKLAHIIPLRAVADAAKLAELADAIRVKLPKAVRH